MLRKDPQAVTTRAKGRPKKDEFWSDKLQMWSNFKGVFLKALKDHVKGQQLRFETLRLSFSSVLIALAKRMS